MGKFKKTIFGVSLQPFRRLMMVLVIVPYLYGPIGKQDAFCIKYTQLVIHFIAVAALSAYLVYAHLKRIKETIYNLDDIFSSIMDGLGFTTLIIAQLIIHLESSCKLHAYQKIFNKFEQMRTWLMQKFAIQFEITKLKFYATLLQIHFTLYCGLIFFFMTWLIFEPVPTMRLLLCLYAEIVLKVKLFEYMLFVIVFLVMLSELCRAANRQCQLVESTRFDSSVQRQECLMGFIALQDLHALLWENVQLLTAYFEWSLPSLFTKQLIDLTLLAYWAFLNIEIGKSEVIKYYLIAFWIMQIFTLMVACFICSTCERSERKFRSSFRTIFKDRQNPLLMKCVHSISMQLWQEPITFVAGHFLTINIRTLGKYFFTVAMYIVILIQFRLSV
ncbi:PREDICTED: putative gustatory receptor 98a [Rhagoletis zephyria]|uniref:putative gustatory receptor 98a n=1 Tax=Rhagoletis zephyria TaxID=28612 RepID=UPI0008117B54|nr:PREDICTED: putative gustatory receptor 98a [Rhagoletis zephyria]